MMDTTTDAVAFGLAVGIFFTYIALPLVRTMAWAISGSSDDLYYAPIDLTERPPTSIELMLRRSERRRLSQLSFLTGVAIALFPLAAWGAAHPLTGVGVVTCAVLALASRLFALFVARDRGDALVPIESMKDVLCLARNNREIRTWLMRLPEGRRPTESEYLALKDYQERADMYHRMVIEGFRPEWKLEVLT